MTNKGNGQSSDLYSLASMAKSCGFMLGDNGQDVFDGEMESCPAPIEAELRLLIGKHPNINTVTDASLVVAEVGTKVIMNMVQGHKPGASTPCMTEEVPAGLEQVLAGGEHFQVFPLYPSCKLAFRLCCACFAELQGVQADLKLPLEEVIKIALVAGLAVATDWITESQRALSRREMNRFHDWLIVRLKNLGVEGTKICK